MQIRNAPSSEKPTESDGLLDCRMAMLGLDFDALKQSDGEILRPNHARVHALRLSGSVRGGFEARSQQPGMGNLLSERAGAHCAYRGSLAFIVS